MQGSSMCVLQYVVEYHKAKYFSSVYIWDSEQVQRLGMSYKMFAEDIKAYKEVGNQKPAMMFKQPVIFIG